MKMSGSRRKVFNKVFNWQARFVTVEVINVTVTSVKKCLFP